MQPVWLCIISGIQFEDTHEKTHWRKIKQMQPVWLCIFWCSEFEETFENTHWRKIKQIQPVWLCLLLPKFFEETYEEAQPSLEGRKVTICHCQQTLLRTCIKSITKPWELEFKIEIHMKKIITRWASHQMDLSKACQEMSIATRMRIPWVSLANTQINIYTNTQIHNTRMRIPCVSPANSKYMHTIALPLMMQTVVILIFLSWTHFQVL